MVIWSGAFVARTKIAFVFKNLENEILCTMVRFARWLGG